MEQYYHMLGVLPTTKLKDIKKKYFKLMRKTHPDKSGQDEQCKKITEAYRKIIRYKLENIVDDDEFIPLGFNVSKHNIKHAENNTEKKDSEDTEKEDTEKKDTPLILMDKYYKKKSMFEKMFDFFFNLDSDDDSSSDDSSYDSSDD